MKSFDSQIVLHCSRNLVKNSTHTHARTRAHITNTNRKCVTGKVRAPEHNNCDLGHRIIGFFSFRRRLHGDSLRRKARSASGVLRQGLPDTRGSRRAHDDDVFYRILIIVTISTFLLLLIIVFEEFCSITLRVENESRRMCFLAFSLQK